MEIRQAKRDDLYNTAVFGKSFTEGYENDDTVISSNIANGAHLVYN